MRKQSDLLNNFLIEILFSRWSKLYDTGILFFHENICGFQETVISEDWNLEQNVSIKWSILSQIA